MAGGRVTNHASAIVVAITDRGDVTAFRMACLRVKSISAEAGFKLMSSADWDGFEATACGRISCRFSMCIASAPL